MEVPATVAVVGTSVYECNGFRLVAKKKRKRTGGTARGNYASPRARTDENANALPAERKLD